MSRSAATASSVDGLYSPTVLVNASTSKRGAGAGCGRGAGAEGAGVRAGAGVAGLATVSRRAEKRHAAPAQMRT